MMLEKIQSLRSAGVVIGDEVNPEKISSSSHIYAGCRILGAETSIGPGCVIGREAPVVIENCQLGRNVELKGGYFSGAVFFDGANMGSGAHVRAGTILEEKANGAHTVGLKQTILLPFVTLGSLINFCDILMAGGTNRKNHSEVGSSYIHFNFTPHQDKATASLVGDIPRGVFLDQKPIFLGGQGGLVGPARIAYGSVIAAGGVCRKDLSIENQLYVAGSLKSTTQPYEMGVYGKVDRIIKNNLAYIGNILALREWYRVVRSRFIRDQFDQSVLDGGMMNLNLILKERIKCLDDLSYKMEYSSQWLKDNDRVIEEQLRFGASWSDIKNKLTQEVPDQNADTLERFAAGFTVDESYIETIQALDPSLRNEGCSWLQSIVDSIEQLWS